MSVLGLTGCFIGELYAFDELSPPPPYLIVPPVPAFISPKLFVGVFNFVLSIFVQTLSCLAILSAANFLLQKRQGFKLAASLSSNSFWEPSEFGYPNGLKGLALLHAFS